MCDKDIIMSEQDKKLETVLDSLGVDNATKTVMVAKEKKAVDAGRAAGIMACENLQNKTFSTRCY